MASPIYLTTLKLPLTEKPITAFSAENQATYTDIFNLQNTIKIVMQNFTEEAPEDGEEYVRKDGEWVQPTSSGGIPEAPIDGKLYGRKDADWDEITAGEGKARISYPSFLPTTAVVSTSAVAGKALILRVLEPVTLTEVGGFIQPESSTDVSYKGGVVELTGVTLVKDLVTAVSTSSVPPVESAPVIVQSNTRIQRIKCTLTSPVLLIPGKFYAIYLNRIESPITVGAIYFIASSSSTSIWQATFNAVYYQGTPRWGATTPPLNTSLTMGTDQYIIFAGGTIG